MLHEIKVPETGFTVDISGTPEQISQTIIDEFIN